jgi:hypothetical protein
MATNTSFPIQPQTFAEKIVVFTGSNARKKGGEWVYPKTSARQIFERQPSHPLERRWALYVNLNRLEKAVLSKRRLPRLTVYDSQMHWISERGSTQWEKNDADLPELYLFRFALVLEVGEDPLGIRENCFQAWGVQNERDSDDLYDRSLDFYHQAPAPVLPWPGACVRALEMPDDLALAVFAGVRQAEEAILVALGHRNPAITALMA